MSLKKGQVVDSITIEVNDFAYRGHVFAGGKSPEDMVLVYSRKDVGSDSVILLCPSHFTDKIEDVRERITKEMMPKHKARLPESSGEAKDLWMIAFPAGVKGELRRPREA